MRSSISLIFYLFIAIPVVLANPYYDPSQVPVTDKQLLAKVHRKLPPVKVQRLRDPGSNAIRVRIDWIEATDSYQWGGVYEENSGTPALIARSKKRPAHGSYLAILKDAESKKPFAFASIGTGKEFRKMSRALSFRFPKPTKPALIEFIAEHPISGEMERVFEMSLPKAEKIPPPPVEVRLLKNSTHPHPLQVNVYAEGYQARDKERFFSDAQKVYNVFHASSFPEFSRFKMFAVFAPSNKRLVSDPRPVFPVPEQDSFLGLYFPYWNDFGRWYHVVYPTRVEKFRRALASVPYDYPIALVKHSSYWGVGNFHELTAIPSTSKNFSYLLLHEFGHFLGLNEEYGEGGRTELEFAFHIKEPWSQNMSFLLEPEKLKWKSFVLPRTPLPTPATHWDQNGKNIGAYEGGYGQSPSHTPNHKPGLSCIMDKASHFCPVCTQAIADQIIFDSEGSE